MTQTDGDGRYAGGRDAEFGAFVLARPPQLLRLATLLAAGDAHLAEDLVQTALTRLYVAWWRVERDQGAEAYCRRAQAPLRLHWDEATLGRFLAAVTVGDGAVAGVG